MTTSSLSIRSLASGPGVSVHRVLSRHHFSSWYSTAQLIGDLMSIFAGIWVGGWICRTWFTATQTPLSTSSMLELASVVAALSVLFLHTLNAHRTEPSPLDIHHSERLIRTIVSILATLTAFSWILHLGVRVVLVAGTSVMCTFIYQRNGMRRLIRLKPAMFRDRSRAAIYGSKYNPISLASYAGAPGSDWVWVGNIRNRPGPELVGAEVSGSILGCWTELDCIVAEHGISDIVVAASEVTLSELHEISQDCARLNLALSIVTVPGCISAISLESTYIDGIPSWRLVARPAYHPLTAIAKRVFDVLLATALATALVPLLLLVSVLVAVDSPGPIFFRHKRIGKDGRPFAIWKFRSMKKTASLYERSPREDCDPRLTRVGRILRRFSMDELPQLLNVIKGEMSLVGPRPEMPFIVDSYQPFERLRLQVLPGMTGLWQISPARAMPIHAHMEYDLYYIARQNFFLDLAILFRTFNAVFRGMAPNEEDAHPNSGQAIER